MATKALGTLVLIIEKQHASWDLMCSTLPALELRFRRQPHVASARPLGGASGPCTILVVCACVELTNGLPYAIGLHTIQWTTEAWLAAAGHTSHGFGCGLADTVPRRRSGWASSTASATGVCPVRWSHMCKWDL